MPCNATRPLSVLPFVLALGLASGCSAHRAATRESAAAPTPDGIAALSLRFDSLRQAAHIPGLAVAVLQDGKVVLMQGFGSADLEAGVAVTPDTPFNIASVAKTISAVVALRLAEQGKLDLDRPMATYEGFPEFCRDVQGDGGIFFRDLHCDTEPLTLRHVMSMESNGDKVGERFFYNPVLYSWASRPMRQVTGTPFSTLVAEQVFAPAGMTASARTNRDLPLPPAMAAALAKPYHLDAAGKQVRSEGPRPQGDGAAGGVITTVRDLARFDQALDGDRLLTPASKATMWRPGRSSAGVFLPYGIGWFVKDLNGERVVWHTGLWEGAYSALYLKVPSRRLTLILLANSAALRWESPLDGALVERSPFAQAFFAHFGVAQPASGQNGSAGFLRRSAALLPESTG